MAKGPARKARVASALAASAAMVLATAIAQARPPADPRVEIVSRDGRSWDAVLREIEADPATLGRSYALAVRSGGSRVPCGEYDLSLDEAASKAFAIEACEVASGETRLRVVDRGPLFAPGDVVPRPRAVSVRAVVHQTATAWGGGDAPAAGSKIWCTVALEPYVWDGLHGAAVPLPPERFELVPLDGRVRASPDGSGWIARGESHMDVLFRYEVRDRATGAKVLEDVATLSCADGPVATRLQPAVMDIPAWAYPPTPPRTPDVTSWAARRPSPPPPVVDPRAQAFASDLRLIAAGALFGASDVQMQLLGVQLGMGTYVSDRWYLGGSASWSMLEDMGDMEDGITNLFQLGPEARYAFHVGQGSVRTNGGPRRPIPYVDWLGLRGGLEEVGPGTIGAFAEASWGSEFRTGIVYFGTVIAAGTGLDAAGAYGDATVVHPYANLAIRVGLNL